MVITYEQCPWDLPHVESIYRNLAGKIVADDEWHSVEGLKRQVGWYRVKGRCFQAIFAPEETPLTERLRLMDPVQTEDDAEWCLWELSKGRGYGLSTVFASTPNLIGYPEELEECLERHALSLETRGNDLRGVAYFTDLEPGCVGDAMERIAWLENAIMSLNRRLKAECEAFWAPVVEESRRVIASQLADAHPLDIEPVPDTFRGSGRKRREPVSSPEHAAELMEEWPTSQADRE